MREDGDGVMMAAAAVGFISFLCGGLFSREVTQEQACDAQCGEHWDWDDGCVCLEEARPASRSQAYEEEACP